MLKKSIIYTTFAIATIVVVAIFLTSTNYLQLGIAVLLYPLVALFALKILPRKNNGSQPVAMGLQVQPTTNPLEVNPPATNAPVSETGKFIVSDIDKRVFLKLIGATGISLFLYSVLFKKAESSFFGKSMSAPETVSIKDSGGRKIDPAEKQPTDAYRIAEIDDNIITYYGFIDKDGNWFIMREDTDTGSFRYFKGDANFASNWSSREQLTFGYYNDIF